MRRFPLFKDCRWEISTEKQSTSFSLAFRQGWGWPSKWSQQLLHYGPAMSPAITQSPSAKSRVEARGEKGTVASPLAVLLHPSPHRWGSSLPRPVGETTGVAPLRSTPPAERPPRGGRGPKARRQEGRPRRNPRPRPTSSIPASALPSRSPSCCSPSRSPSRGGDDHRLALLVASAAAALGIAGVGALACSGAACDCDAGWGRRRQAPQARQGRHHAAQGRVIHEGVEYRQGLRHRSLSMRHLHSRWGKERVPLALLSISPSFPATIVARATTRFSPYCNKSLRQHHYFGCNRGYYCTETVIWLQFVCLLQHKIWVALFICSVATCWR
jgi:hypothetical protein